VILLEKVFVVRFALVFPKLSVELCLHLGLTLDGEGTKVNVQKIKVILQNQLLLYSPNMNDCLLQEREVPC